MTTGVATNCLLPWCCHLALYVRFRTLETYAEYITRNSPN